GRKHLEQHKTVDPLILRVAEEHHERLDGSGYPQGLTGDHIDPISKICAVVDSFDAMTAFRPYKECTMTVRQAMDALAAETPAKYDPVVMTAWRKLMNTVKDAPLPVMTPRDRKKSSESGPRSVSRRKYERFKLHCSVRVHLVE